MMAVLSENNLHVADAVQLLRDWWAKDANGGMNVKELMSKIRVGQTLGGHTSNLSQEMYFAVGVVKVWVLLREQHRPEW
jgi:quercetin dioxygenase-like cupin family protein